MSGQIYRKSPRRPHMRPRLGELTYSSSSSAPTSNSIPTGAPLSLPNYPPSSIYASSSFPPSNYASTSSPRIFFAPPPFVGVYYMPMPSSTPLYPESLTILAFYAQSGSSTLYIFPSIVSQTSPKSMFFRGRSSSQPPTNTAGDI